MNERLDIQLEFKDRVISKILLAEITTPIDARKMWEEWNLEARYGISIEGWQRIVTKIVEAYQVEQFGRAQMGSSANLIMSCGKGYYCCKTEEDAFKGVVFYYERMFPMFKRRKFYKDFIKLKFHKNIDRKEMPGQMSLL